MGQQPSCMMPDSLPHKDKSVSYQPDPQHEVMTSPRHTHPHHSHTMSPTRTSASQSQSQAHSYSPSLSALPMPSSPSHVSKPLKTSLSIDASDDTTLAQASTGTLLSWIKRHTTSASTVPAYVVETPKGALATQYPHFCPICYRYFRAIYSTSCCGHNVCHDCAHQYVTSKRPGMKVVTNIELPLSCPSCNQTEGVAFVALTQDDDSKVYAESPRTQQLLEQARHHQHAQQLHQQQARFFA